MLRQLLATKHPHAAHTEAEGLSLRRTLGPWGLTALGIGAVIGGGIFVITGQAAANHAGPAIMLSFVLAAICCTFCALAYAEFAAMVPVSGSAYTYTYATLGELTAWFIGWMLVLEYGVSASAVAVSWTGYFLSLLEHFNIYLPQALVSAPLDAQLRPTGAIANVPAAVIVLLLTWLCYVGIRKSSAMNMAMVVLKTGLIVLVIVAGWQYVDPGNWQPFIPANEGPGKFGWDGVLRGAAMVFFAYIGFEAVSVAAQESHRPQKDLPVGMLASLAICTILYIAMAAVMTGLVPYTALGTAEPVVTAVAAHPELGWLRVTVEIGALIGLSSVVLVMIIGLHIGLHWHIVAGLARARLPVLQSRPLGAVLWVLAILVAALGVNSSFVMGLGTRLGFDYGLIMWDFTESTLPYFAHWLAITVLYAVIAHAALRLLTLRRRALPHS